MNLLLTAQPGAFQFFSFLLLMMFFRANAMFAYLTDKVLRGLNNAESTRLQNAMTQVTSVAVEILLLGIAMQWLDQVVSVLFFFLKYSLTVCHVAGHFDRRQACLGSNGSGAFTAAAIISPQMYIH